MTLTTHPTTLSIHGSEDYSYKDSTTYSVTQVLLLNPAPGREPKARSFTLIQDAQLDAPRAHQVNLYNLKGGLGFCTQTILRLTIKVHQVAQDESTWITRNFSTHRLTPRKIDLLHPIEFELGQLTNTNDDPDLPPLPNPHWCPMEMSLTFHDFTPFRNCIDQLRTNTPSPKKQAYFNTFASELAFYEQKPELTKALLFYHPSNQAFSKPDLNGNYPIHLVVEDEALAEFESVVKSRPESLYFLVGENRTVIQQVVKQDWSEALLTALDTGKLDAKVMRVAPGQRSFVHFAAEHGAELCIDVLAKRFPECLRHQDEQGRTPLVTLLQASEDNRMLLENGGAKNTLRIICQRDPGSAKIPSPSGKLPIELAFDLDPELAQALLGEVPECSVAILDELVDDEHFGFLEKVLGWLATSMEPVDLRSFTRGILTLPETQQQAAAQSYLTNSIEVDNTDHPPLAFLLNHAPTRSALFSLTSGQDYPLGDLLMVYQESQTLDPLLQSCPGLLEETRPGTRQTLREYVFSGTNSKRVNDQDEPLAKKVKKCELDGESEDDDH